MSNSLWPHGLQHQASLSFIISQSLLKLKSSELMMPSNQLILCNPLLLLSSVFPSIRVFSDELAFCIRWPKYWNFSFSIIPSNECSGLISPRIDWFDLLAVQEILKTLLQHHSLKASILWHSAKGEWMHVNVLLSHSAVRLKLSHTINQLWKKVKVIFIQLCLTLSDPWTVAHQSPLSIGSLQTRILECHSLLQGIFLTQGLNLVFLPCKHFLYHLSHQGSSVHQLYSNTK